MEHLALYRQFRPMTFDEVVEQKHIVTALRQSVATGQIAHAYLFSGTRGTGKTSVAKILSRAINCLNPDNGNPCNRCEICTGILDGSLIDVIEMDAASNNSVDNIRRVCDEVLFMPSRAKYKVYIVDEVHMLSTGAFNALLKTLEEPPAHAVFILATTEPHRIPATIISRCQRYDFRRIPLEAIVERLRDISDKNGIPVRDEALETIAKLSDGALRDAISLLDQVSGDFSSVIQRDDVIRMTGVVDDRFLLSMAESILSGKSVDIIELCDRLIMDGRDILRFTLDLARYFRDLLVVGISRRPENLVRATAESFVEMRRLSDCVSKDAILRVITRLSDLASELKWSPDMRTSFEIALLALGSENMGKQVVSARAKEPDTVGSIAQNEPAGTPSAVEPAPHPAPPPVDFVHEEALPAGGPVPDLIPPPDADPEDVPLRDEILRAMTSEGQAPSSSASDLSRIAPVTPNLTRAAEPVPPVQRPVTNLSVVTSGPSVRNPNIPLPPVIPDTDYASDHFTGDRPAESAGEPVTDSQKHPLSQAEEETIQLSPDGGTDAPDRVIAPDTAPDEKTAPETAPGSSETRSIKDLWDILMKRWEETMFLEALQMRHARVEIREDELRVVFPDIMRPYIDQLTPRNEYKKIKEDVLTLITGIRDLRLTTDSDTDSGSLTADKSVTDRPVPDWVGKIKAFAEQNGVELQTTDDLKAGD